MRQRGDAFYFEREVEGQRQKFRLPFTEAKAIKRATEVNELLAESRSVEHLKTGQRMTVARFVEQMNEDAGVKRDATRKCLRARLRTLTRFLELRYPAISRLSSVTPEVAAVFLEWRSRTAVPRNGSPNSKGLKQLPSQATLNEDVRIMRGFFARAVELKWLPANPFASIKPPRQPTRAFEPYALSEREIDRLLGAAVDYDAEPPCRGAQSTYRGYMADMTRLFLLTGLRAKEMRCLAWAQVDDQCDEQDGPWGRLRIEPYQIKGAIRVRLNPEQAEAVRTLIQRRQGERRLFRTKEELRGIIPGKYIQSETRGLMLLRPIARVLAADALILRKRFRFRPKASSGNIPLTPEAKMILMRRRAAAGDSPFVFAHPDGGRLRSDYWAQFKIVLRAAGLPDRVRVHDLRHTFGMRLRRNGVPLETIMGLMRHKNINETRLYAPYRESEGAAAIQCLSGSGQRTATGTAGGPHR